MTFSSGAHKTFFVRGIFNPPTGGSPFGTVTISQTAWDKLNANPQNLYSFVRMTRRRHAAERGDARPRAEAVPGRQGGDPEEVHRQPDQRSEVDPEHLLRAARAVRDREPVRDRQHARADGVRADARDRDAARDRDDAPAGAPHDPARERDHRADRRCARDRARHRARRRCSSRASTSSSSRCRSSR